jgi:hypothetical protein
MENGRQLDVNLYQRHVGESVELSVLRGDAVRDVRVWVTERRDDPTRFVELVTPERNLVAELGILALDIDVAVAEMLVDRRKDGGVLVAARSADTPYVEGYFRPGDIIYAVNGDEVDNLKDLRQALGGMRHGDAAAIQVERGGRLQFVAVEVE